MWGRKDLSPQIMCTNLVWSDLDAALVTYTVEQVALLVASVDVRLSVADVVQVVRDFTRRKCRVKPLRDGNNDLLKDYDDYCEGAITEIVALSREVTDRATAIRGQYGFKTPDAIHLSAAAVIWGAIYSSPMTIGLITFPI
jgi:uncharacterized protein